MSFDPRPSLPPVPGAKLFEQVILQEPAAEAVIKAVLADIMMEVVKRGGHMSVVTDGPEQGITVECDGRVIRLNPKGPIDQEDEALVRSHIRRYDAGLDPRVDNDALSSGFEALRVLAYTESRSRSRKHS